VPPPLSEILNTPLYGVVLPSHQEGFGEGVSKDFKRFFYTTQTTESDRKPAYTKQISCVYIPLIKLLGF